MKHLGGYACGRHLQMVLCRSAPIAFFYFTFSFSMVSVHDFNTFKSGVDH